MYQNPYKAYQQTQVTTASPEKILLMLYEGAIRFIKTAQVRLDEKKLAEKGQAVSKALAIVSELMNTLDHNKGGALAVDLENLYMFVIDKLIEGNIHNRAEDLQAAERIMTILYSGWEDVINNPRADGVPSSKLQPALYERYETAQKNAAQPAGGASVPTAAQQVAVQAAHVSRGPSASNPAAASSGPSSPQQASPAPKLVVPPRKVS